MILKVSEKHIMSGNIFETDSLLHDRFNQKIIFLILEIRGTDYDYNDSLEK